MKPTLSVCDKKPLRMSVDSTRAARDGDVLPSTVVTFQSSTWALFALRLVGLGFAKSRIG